MQQRYACLDTETYKQQRHQQVLGYAVFDMLQVEGAGTVRDQHQRGQQYHFTQNRKHQVYLCSPVRSRLSASE